MAKARAIVKRRKAVQNIRKITRTMELIATARFKKALDRGYRMVELLKQPQYNPMDVVDQVMSLYAGSEGYLDDVPVKEVQRWEAEFLTYMREQKSSVRDRLAREKKLSDAILADLKAALVEFKQLYRPGAPKAAPRMATAGA